MYDFLAGRRILRFTLTAGLALLASAASAGNWPHWRGPNYDGLSSETGIPTEWSAEKNVAWRFPLPGPAGASPVVWGENVFVTSTDGADLVLICLGTDGKERWRRTVGTGDRSVRGDEGNMASPSPTTDGEHVWTMMGTGDLACYDMDGKEVWKFNLQDRYGKFKIAFGMSASPIQHGGKLFLQLIHGDGKAETQEAIVLGLNAITGEEIWKRDRVTGASNENEHSYASPMLYNFDDTAYLVTHGADYTIAHRLSDGTEIWRLEELNPQDDPQRTYHRTLRFVASPGISKDLIVVPTAKNYPVFAVRPDAEGTFGTEGEAFVWQFPKTPDVPTPLILDGLVYLCMQNGNLHCLEADTGEEIYQKRTHVIRHRGSPVYADGKIFLSARDGKVTIVKPGRDFEILAQNDIGEDLSASPAISNGTIYLRTFDALWAIRGK